MRKIAIIVAMQSEADAIISSLQLHSVKISEFLPELPMKCYYKKADEGEIYLITNGMCTKYGVNRVATQPAAITTLEVIRSLNPDLIISAGTAGGFRETGASIGDVYLATKYYMYHDRQIPSGNSEKYGIGYFHCPNVMKIAETLNIKTGIISSGNSLTYSAENDIIIKSHKVSAKEMEVAAIAEVAQMFNIKVIALKAITNIVEQKANVAGEFEKNFSLAIANLVGTLPKVINLLFSNFEIIASN